MMGKRGNSWSSSQSCPIMEEEMVFIKSLHYGKVKVDLISVQCDTKIDATSISGAKSNIMESQVGNDWKKKLVWITTDGAAADRSQK